MFFFYKYIYTLYHQKNKNKKLDVFYHRNVIGFNIVTIEKFTSTQDIKARLYTNIYTLKLKKLHREFTYKYGLHNKILTQLSTIQLTHFRLYNISPHFRRVSIYIYFVMDTFS